MLSFQEYSTVQCKLWEEYTDDEVFAIEHFAMLQSDALDVNEELIFDDEVDD